MEDWDWIRKLDRVLNIAILCIQYLRYRYSYSLICINCNISPLQESLASVPFCKSHKSSLDTFSEKVENVIGTKIIHSEKVIIFLFTLSFITTIKKDEIKVSMKSRFFIIIIHMFLFKFYPWPWSPPLPPFLKFGL